MQRPLSSYHHHHHLNNLKIMNFLLFLIRDFVLRRKLYLCAEAVPCKSSLKDQLRYYFQICVVQTIILLAIQQIRKSICKTNISMHFQILTTTLASRTWFENPKLIKPQSKNNEDCPTSLSHISLQPGSKIVTFN